MSAADEAAIEAAADAMFDILYDIGGSDSTRADKALARAAVEAAAPYIAAQALGEAAEEQERLSTGPRAMGSKAVQFKRMLFADWLRERAAAVAPRETKD